jgi:hypothetical protein
MKRAVAEPLCSPVSATHRAALYLVSQRLPRLAKGRAKTRILSRQLGLDLTPTYVNDLGDAQLSFQLLDLGV